MKDKKDKKAEKLAAKEAKKQKKAEKKEGKKKSFPFGALVLLALSVYYIVTALMAAEFKFAEFTIDTWFTLIPGASLLLFALTLLPKKPGFLQVLGGFIATAGQSVIVADYLQTDDKVSLIASILMVVAFAMMTVMIIVRRSTKKSTMVLWLLPVLAAVASVVYPIVMTLPLDLSTTDAIIELVTQALTVVGIFAASLRIARIAK